MEGLKTRRRHLPADSSTAPFRLHRACSSPSASSVSAASEAPRGAPPTVDHPTDSPSPAGWTADAALYSRSAARRLSALLRERRELHQPALRDEAGAGDTVRGEAQVLPEADRPPARRL